MRILRLNKKNIVDEAVNILKAGGILIYPTETVYGVGVDATNENAVTKLLEYKKRPEGKAISVAVADEKKASEYAEINSTAKNLYANFLPGPLTVISKSKKKVDRRLESENGNLGVRIPDHKLLLEILKKFGKPVTSTSANSTGKKTPYSVEDILNNVSEKQKALINLVIDAGELPKRQSSSVVDTTTSELKTYRQGAMKISEKSIEYSSGSALETVNLGKEQMKKKMEDLSKKPVIFLLYGELGAGKTHFTKGVAEAVGITRTIKSPTYNYVDEYDFQIEKVQDKNNQLDINGKMYHFDAWRLQSKADLEALRFHEWLGPSNIIVVEWPNILFEFDSDIFGEFEYTSIVINEVEEKDKRNISIA